MTTQEKLIKSKLNLLDLASYLGNVSEACRTLGYSRNTFCRLKKRYEDSGIDGLKEMSRRKPNLRNRVPEEIEGAVLELAVEYPAFGPLKAAAKLVEVKAYKLSAAGVRGIWLRHGLETKKKRLKALEAKVGEALRDEDADQGGRPAKRPRAPVLRGRRHAPAGDPDRPGHGVLRQPGAA